MKLLAGVVLAGAVAVGVYVGAGFHARPVGDGAPPLPAEKPRTPLKDPPPDQRYRPEILPARDPGPATQGLDVDDSGTVYYVSSRESQVRAFSREKNRTEVVAGSTFGVLDGPLARARFGGWGYNSPALIAVSRDGAHVFVLGRRIWRHIDRRAGVVRTIAPYKRSGSCFVIVKDRSGEIYAFQTSGEDVPECPGYRRLKVARFKRPGRGGTYHQYLGKIQGHALDAESMRYYYHRRGDVEAYDLRTGKMTNLNPGPKRKTKTLGDVKTWNPWCPLGLSISPSGRWLYVGGGDDPTCWRFDLEKDRCDALSFTNDGSAVLFRGDEWNRYRGLTRTEVRFAPDGTMYTASGALVRLTPVKQ